MKYILALLFISVVAYADSEPRIEIYQDSEKNTSVIVVTWPDGVVEKLLYKNKDVRGNSVGYTRWFNQRYDAYERRSK